MAMDQNAIECGLGTACRSGRPAAARSPEWSAIRQPAPLRGQSADRVEQQAVGEEQGQDRDRLRQLRRPPRHGRGSQVAKRRPDRGGTARWPADRPDRRRRHWPPGSRSRPRAAVRSSGPTPASARRARAGRRRRRRCPRCRRRPARRRSDSAAPRTASGHVDGGVVSRGEEQGHHDGRRHGRRRPAGRGRFQVRVGQVEIGRLRGISIRLLGDLSQQPLDRRDAPAGCRLPWASPISGRSRLSWSAGLAVGGVAVAARAELLQLKAIRVVTPVLLGDVVPLLALGAGQRDLRPYIGRSWPWSFLDLSCLALRGAGSGSGTRTRDTAIMSRLLYRLSYPAVVIATSVAWSNNSSWVSLFRRCAAAPETKSEPPCGIEPQTFSLPWRRSAY